MPMTIQSVQVNDIQIGPGYPLALIAGPCVIESEELTHKTAAFLRDLTQRLKMPFIFKSSYDKANRTAIDSYRGPGLKKGLSILSDIKKSLGVPVLSDVHTSKEAALAGEVLDIIQVPAFLCRQTDFILAAAHMKKPLNIKKGQFLAPGDVANIVSKAKSAGNQQIMITERGTSFGYNNLVVDFRGIKIIRDTGVPVIFDATHSVQLPGGSGTQSGGERKFAPVLAKAAVAAGADGIFMEVHPDPDNALCDGPNSLPLASLELLLTELLAIRKALGIHDEIL